MSNKQQLVIGNAARNMATEEPTIGLHLTTTSLLSAQTATELEIIRKHAGDIIELKEQLEQKDAEIAELRKKVKKLEEKNNNLLIKLQGKDEEVKTLKERIQTLEEEKKTLQEELASVQFKLKGIEEEVKKLRKSREADEEKSLKLDEELKKIHFTLKDVKDDLEATKSENEVLKKQVRHQSRYVAGTLPLMSLQSSEDTSAQTNLGEMCWQIEAEFYKRILPDYFTPIRSYKVATLKKDIEKLYKTIEEKSQALNRWEDLKDSLPLNEEDLEEALDALQDRYNRSFDTNPPNLSVKVLRESAESLEKQRILKGWISLERVNGLIDIWKRLVDCGEKA